MEARETFRELPHLIVGLQRKTRRGNGQLAPGGSGPFRSRDFKSCHLSNLVNVRMQMEERHPGGHFLAEPLLKQSDFPEAGPQSRAATDREPSEAIP